MKAAFPRGARAFRSERWLVKLATTIPRSGGSPLHLAPRVWGRRAGCAVSWSSGHPEGTRRDVSPAAVGAVGRASVYVLFRAFFFYGALLFVYTIVPRYLPLGMRLVAATTADEGSMGRWGRWVSAPGALSSSR